MATRTTNKQIQLKNWLSYQEISSFVSTLLQKMKIVFSAGEENISQSLVKIRENQVNNLGIELMTTASYYSRRI